MKTVTIVQRVLPHYRIPFFSGLNESLLARGIQLSVMYGKEFPGMVPKTVDVDSPWGTPVDNHYFLGDRIVWQHLPDIWKTSDLVILEHSAQLLSNNPILIRRWLRPTYRLAFWGHGKNMQFAVGGENGALRPFERFREAPERYKRIVANHADWWFAYTESSARTVEALGFPRARITVVNNSIDTTALARAVANVSADDRTALCRELGLDGSNVCIYCGGMYANKRLDFLVAACDRIRQLVPDFEVVFIGAGPESAKIRAAAESRPWMHYVGEKYGAEVARYYAISRLLLMPGLVGLAAVDSFVAETPLVTTNAPIHSPEASYLSKDVNAVIADFDADDYARRVAEVLSNPARLERLRLGCRESAAQFSVQRMIENFRSGIESALG